VTAWVTSTIGLLVAAIILFLIRRDRLHVRHGLVWVGVAAGFAVLGLFPGALDRIAQWLGIAYPPVLALTIAIALLVLKVLAMDIERARLETRSQRLVQRLGMLEADLRQLRRGLEQAPRRDPDGPAE
jgi:hypothetical protein